MVETDRTNETIFSSAAQTILGELTGGFWILDRSSGALSVYGALASQLEPGASTLSKSIDWLRGLMEAEERAALDSFLFAHLDTEEVFSFEHRLGLAGGQRRWFRTRGKAFGNKGRQAPLVYGVTDDIDTLVRERRAAEDANFRKTSFLINLSHELRTPLNGVLGMAQLLERSALDERQARFVGWLNASSNALLSIIDDVLDISRIEAGHIQLEEQALDLPRMAEEVRDAAAGLVAEKNLVICTKIDPLIERENDFVGDYKRISQVILNLTGNAVKFTEEGSVVIGMAPGEAGAIVFSVTDTGPGISKTQQRLIFERFSQADGSVSRKHGGTGLGLAISKELVEAMGGTIGVESRPGAGARFWFSLPLKRKKPSRGGAVVSAVSHASGPRPAIKAPMRVLLAEDNPVHQEVIGELLSLPGAIALTRVGNGSDALTALGSAEFDLVLMDINMPVMTGDEAIKRIRASDKTWRDVPIIVLSANAVLEHRQRFLDVGANHYLPKPIDADVLLPMVERFRPPLVAIENAKTPDETDETSAG